MNQKKSRIHWLLYALIIAVSLTAQVAGAQTVVPSSSIKVINPLAIYAGGTVRFRVEGADARASYTVHITDSDGHTFEVTARATGTGSETEFSAVIPATFATGDYQIAVMSEPKPPPVQEPSPTTAVSPVSSGNPVDSKADVTTRGGEQPTAVTATGSQTPPTGTQPPPAQTPPSQPSVVAPQEPPPDIAPPGMPIAVSSDATDATLSTLLNRASGILDSFIPFIIGLAVVLIIWKILSYIGSAGNEEKLAEAKHFIIWGVVGVFCMLSLWGFVNLLLNSFTLQTVIRPGDIPKVPTVNPL